MIPCKKCGNKLLLGSACISTIIPDQEPYEADELEEMDEIDINILLDVHYCEKCIIIHDISDDEKVHLIGN